MIKNKRSQSQIISTVLLILLVISAITILSVFLIGFVNKYLDDASCQKYSDKVKIMNNQKYSCYDSLMQTVRVQIKIESDSKDIAGFKLELGGADSVSYEINPSKQPPLTNIFMFNGGPLTLPKDTEERTYNITGISFKPESINVYPILTKNNHLCSSIEGLDSVSDCVNI